MSTSPVPAGWWHFGALVQPVLPLLHVSTQTDLTGAGSKERTWEAAGWRGLWVREQCNVSMQISAQHVSVLGAAVTNSTSSKLRGEGNAGGICLAQERRKAGLSSRGAGHCQHIPEIPTGCIPAPCSVLVGPFGATPAQALLPCPTSPSPT